MTLLDAIFIGFTAISAFLALVRGFSREVLSIISWVVAGFAAYLFYPLFSEFFLPFLGRQEFADLASAAAIFFIVLIIVTIITMRIADFIIDSRIGPLDRTLGFLFGLARGVVVVAVALIFWEWLVAGNEPAWTANAKSRAILDPVGERLAEVVPAERVTNLVEGLLEDGDAEPSDEADPSEQAPADQ